MMNDKNQNTSAPEVRRILPVMLKVENLHIHLDERSTSNTYFNGVEDQDEEPDIDIEAMIAAICAKTGLCKQSVMMVLDAQAEYLDAVCGEDEVDEDVFADFFKPIARYNSERGIWYVYDGKVWQPDTENLKVAELAKLLADKLYVFALTITEEDARKRFIDRVRKLQLRKHRETMLKDAKSVFPLSMKH